MLSGYQTEVWQAAQTGCFICSCTLQTFLVVFWKSTFKSFWKEQEWLFGELFSFCSQRSCLVLIGSDKLKRGTALLSNTAHTVCREFKPSGVFRSDFSRDKTICKGNICFTWWSDKGAGERRVWAQNKFDGAKTGFRLARKYASLLYRRIYGNGGQRDRSPCLVNKGAADQRKKYKKFFRMFWRCAR